MEQKLQLPMVRTSERTTLMRCSRKWWWSYEERLKPNAVSAPLKFGDMVHQALAAYYLPEPDSRTRGKKPKRGPHPAKTFRDLYLQQDTEGIGFGFGTQDEDWIDALELGTAMLEGYVERYGNDQRYRIIAPELPFELLLKALDGSKFLYVGTLDALIEDLETGQLGFFEHKTARNIVLRHLPMDEQAGSYWTYGPEWLAKQGYLKPGQRLDFILYNFLRKGKPDERPKNHLGQYLNKNGSVSKQQPPDLFKRELVYRADEERMMLHERVQHQYADMQAMREGRRPVVKSILNGCTGMYACEFREMCEMHEIGGDWEFLRDTMFTKWEPYEVHDDDKGAEVS